MFSRGQCAALSLLLLKYLRDKSIFEFPQVIEICRFPAGLIIV
jgi:hypothetical protein